MENHKILLIRFHGKDYTKWGKNELATLLLTIAATNDKQRIFQKPDTEKTEVLKKKCRCK